MLRIFRVDKMDCSVDFKYRQIKGMRSGFELGKVVFVGGMFFGRLVSETGQSVNLSLRYPLVSLNCARKS
jgi:hypothetical protein